MRVVIDIPQEVIEKDAEGYFNYFGCMSKTLYETLKNGIVLPQNPTNGDVIKTMFPSIEIIDLPRFKEVYTGIPFGKLIGANIDCIRDWWDASYERGEG